MGEITGRQVFAVTAGAFAIIIAVNVVMAWKAISTFPGLEVKNSYVASQTFDADRAAQEALGWTMTPKFDRGRVTIAFTDKAGLPVEVKSLDVLIGRTTEAKDDVTPAFTYVAGVYEAEVPLNRGNWMVRVRAIAADGTLFEQRQTLQITG